jgi:hypothetical protein
MHIQLGTRSSQDFYNTLRPDFEFEEIHTPILGIRERVDTSAREKYGDDNTWMALTKRHRHSTCLKNIRTTHDTTFIFTHFDSTFVQSHAFR